MRKTDRPNSLLDSPPSFSRVGVRGQCHFIGAIIAGAPLEFGTLGTAKRRARTARGAVAAMVLLAANWPARALEPTEWRNRQPLVLERAGLQKLALPPETLGLARPGLEDLRILDPAGREVPFVFTQPALDAVPTTRPPKTFGATLADSSTVLLLETGTATPLEAVTLATPAPSFLKAVRVEISLDGAAWETLADRTALFRQFGAVQLRCDLQRRIASQIRLTIDDTRTRPVPFSGAILQLAGSATPEVTTPIAVRLVQREEFTGESVLTLDLGGAHVPLASLEFEAAEPLFARTVTFGTRELRDDTAIERTLGSGSIWRVAADGVPSTARFDVPVRFTSPSRELLVHIANGDSPPLAIERVTARQRPRWLVFHAPGPGAYALLTGHPQVVAPRYDLASLATALRDTPPGSLLPGPVLPNPGYRAPDGLADTPLRGAAIDPTPWGFRKPVQLTTAGVQQLEIDLEVLGRAQAGLADLRLVRDGVQVPYLLERPALVRSTPLVVVAAADAKRPQMSRWQMKLPRAGVPITRLTLKSSTTLFQRHLRLYEKIADEHRGERVERMLAAADWSRQPGETSPLRLALPASPTTDLLFLETDNGDNPPLELTAVQASYPVARLLFKTEPGPVALYYGNRAAIAPRYDLALVARQILAAEKSVAALGAEEPTRAGGWVGALLGGVGAGWIFWGVLGLVVVGLLGVVAKLLPKPRPPGA